MRPVGASSDAPSVYIPIRFLSTDRSDYHRHSLSAPPPSQTLTLCLSAISISNTHSAISLSPVSPLSLPHLCNFARRWNARVKKNNGARKREATETRCFSATLLLFQSIKSSWRVSASQRKAPFSL